MWTGYFGIKVPPRSLGEGFRVGLENGIEVLAVNGDDSEKRPPRYTDRAIYRDIKERARYMCSAQLRRPPHELVVNRKQAQRVMRERNLLAKARQDKTKTTDSKHGYRRFPNLVKSLPITQAPHYCRSDTLGASATQTSQWIPFSPAASDWTVYRGLLMCRVETCFGNRRADSCAAGTN